MKYLLTTAFFLSIVLSVSGQILDFDDQLMTTKSFYTKKDYPETLMAASDLIIADITRMEGYYYAGLAYVALEELDKAAYYVEKAKNKAQSESEKNKIDELVAQINGRKTQIQLLKEADKAKTAGQKTRAARLLLQAWEYAPAYGIDPGLEAVAILVDQNQLVEARESIDLLISKSGNEYKSRLVGLKRSIEKTPQVTRHENLLKYTSDGDRYFGREEYSSALTSYEKAYRLDRSTALKTKIENTKEEISYENAMDGNYIGDYESYADAYPYGKYISSVNGTIKRSYVSIAKDYYESRDESGLVKYHNKYLNRYSADDNFKEIKGMLLSYYMSTGKSKLNQKRWADAKSNFRAYLNLRNYGEDAAFAQKAIKKSDRRLNQRSTGFILYTNDAQSPLGISFGRLNKNRVGGYTNIKMNSEIFTGFDVLYTIDDLGENDGVYDILSPTGTVENANISLSLGLTFKLAYPLWGYAGVGAGYYPVYEEYNGYNIRFNGTRTTEETEFYRNTDQTAFQVWPEAGLKLKVSNVLVLKYGFMFQEELIQQIGIGFQVN